MKNKKFDTEEQREKKIAATGHYYRLMIEHAKFVLKDLKRVVPDYDAAQGYELAGFVWLQGWNDMVDGGVYPAAPKAARESLCKIQRVARAFIRDVRKDFGVPKLPFVIGVMGVDGLKADQAPCSFGKPWPLPRRSPSSPAT